MAFSRGPNGIGLPGSDLTETLLFSFYASLPYFFSGVFDGAFSLKTFGVLEKSFTCSTNIASIST
jgi:hypothetical protein